MIEELLPTEVRAAEAYDDASPGALFPAEEAAISGAVDKRRREFTTARRCARDALGRLGHPAVPVVPGARGAPVWPDGVVGSITHCAGYRAAAVARSRDITTLGIDAEPNAPLTPGILEAVALEEERRWVTEFRRRDPSVSWDRLLFSAKESLYKAWFPLASQGTPTLDFMEASVTLDPVAGSFLARLLRAGSEPREFSGRWLARRGLVVTSVALPAGVDAGAGGAPG